MRIRAFFLVGILVWLVSAAQGNEERKIPEPGPWRTKSFLYIAKKYGVPVLSASIQIVHRSSGQERSLYQIQASVDSLPYLELLFRMKNRFTSTVEGESCAPIRYVKEINQEGLLIPKKNYLQTVTFDHPNRRVAVEDKVKKERQEVSVPPDTYDPLSMFARCYLKERLLPDQDIRMSVYDGVKLHQMIFHPRKGRIKSKLYGKVEALCLESNTPFSTFGDREGMIRIWYTADGKKTPISMELDLPVGSVKFDLEEIKESEWDQKIPRS